MESDYDMIPSSSLNREEDAGVFQSYDSRGFFSSYLENLMKSDMKSPLLSSPAPYSRLVSSVESNSIPNMILKTGTSTIASLADSVMSSHTFTNHPKEPEAEALEKMTGDDSSFGESITGETDIYSLVSIIVPIMFSIIVIVGLFGKLSKY